MARGEDPPYHHPFSPSFLLLTTYSFLEAEMEVGAGKEMREWARSNHLVSLVIWVLHSNSLSYLFPSRFNGENGKEKRNSFQQLQMNSFFFTSFQLLFPNLLPSYKFLLETREVKRREVNES